MDRVGQGPHLRRRVGPCGIRCPGRQGLLSERRRPCHRQQGGPRRSGSRWYRASGSPGRLWTTNSARSNRPPKACRRSERWIAGWWWPRRDSNPRFRLERPASWAVLDDGAMDASVILRPAPEHRDRFRRRPAEARGPLRSCGCGAGSLRGSGPVGQLGGEPFLV